MLDPVKYKDWQIAQEAEKTLPSVREYASMMGLKEDELIPYGRTPKLDFIKIMNRLKDRPDYEREGNRRGRRKCASDTYDGVFPGADRRYQ